MRTYPGSGHLISDLERPEYERAYSKQVWERVLTCLVGS